MLVQHNQNVFWSYLHTDGLIWSQQVRLLHTCYYILPCYLYFSRHGTHSRFCYSNRRGLPKHSFNWNPLPQFRRTCMFLVYESRMPRTNFFHFVPMDNSVWYLFVHFLKNLAIKRKTFQFIPQVVIKIRMGLWSLIQMMKRFKKV